MNENVFYNYSKLKLSLLYLPLSFLFLIALLLYSQNSLNVQDYVQIQKSSFYFINHHLGQFPVVECNLTQLGDASILLSFLIIFIIYAPKIWESLLSASIVSLLFSYILKISFLVPRPAQVFDEASFIIIGKKAVGFSSLPSGHSITVFTTLTVLMFALMPLKLRSKILWVFSIFIFGLIVVSSRVGVGAHHPLDVIIGSTIGFLSGLIGIFISRKFKIWNWISNKRYYPIFILLVIVCSISLTMKIINENLIVYYLAIISLFVSLFKITYVYIKK